MIKMRLEDDHGNCLYLTIEERQAFLDMAKTKLSEVRTFAETLVYTGCRISEALEVTPAHVEQSNNLIALRSLKKRNLTVYRRVPVSPEYMDTLNITHRIRQTQMSIQRKVPLWKWTRQYSSTDIIKVLMIEAGIPEAAHRTAKGLRHAYGVAAMGTHVRVTHQYYSKKSPPSRMSFLLKLMPDNSPAQN